VDIGVSLKSRGSEGREDHGTAQKDPVRLMM
jgi:hypothetical protein